MIDFFTGALHGVFNLIGVVENGLLGPLKVVNDMIFGPLADGIRGMFGG